MSDECGVEESGREGQMRRKGEGWARPPRVPLHLPPTDEFTTYYGTASPPTSYGGYGGNAKESAK